MSFPGLTRESPSYSRLSGQGETMTDKARLSNRARQCPSRTDQWRDGVKHDNDTSGARQKHHYFYAFFSGIFPEYIIFYYRTTRFLPKIKQEI